MTKNIFKPAIVFVTLLLLLILAYIDYKTGYVKYDLAKDDRERQLLLYALAMEEDPALKKKGLVPTELVLDMLEKEKPLAFVLENGVMTAPGTGISFRSISRRRLKS